jgi:hypothetical protein
MAVEAAAVPAIELPLAAGADPRLKTRIVRCETPREMAERVGLAEIARLLKAAEGRWPPSG